ncbi:endonuclease MutS2 [[Clostridium] aminophilum]|uniref:endonuclease MutS2 n=1 Tax=[Clostridium] aminophilum TaxID=1526 RepID=UPI003F9B6500
MNAKVLRTLEFLKIRDRLTGFATCDLGRSLCRNLVPSIDPDTIRADQTNTSDAVDRIRMKGGLNFSGTRDLRGSMKRLDIGGALSIPEILAVGSVLNVAKRAIAYGYHEPSEEIPDDSLDELFRRLDPCTSLAAEISRCILSEDEVADDASPGLAKVRREMRQIEGKVHSQLNQILNASRAYLQDGIITTRDGRYCLPVRAEYKAQVPGMVHDQSSTGSTLFIEPMAVIKLNNELRELEGQEKREIEFVLAAISGDIVPYSDTILEDQNILAELDFIFAKAELSRSYKGTEPKFNTDHYISIKDGRHPLLDPEKVVPTTIWLGKDFNLLIVTGPNTGGKTVSLKTVGLFTLMGQAGLHIPAFEGSELSVFTEVFADIGDEQSIEQNLSTFSSHMKTIVEILAKADPNSLCLFDELGAGTDPTEGAALAMSILNFLHNMQCRTMATTHYSELKVYALQTEGVENASCEFNVETLQPTYRLLIGIPGKSNAFAISQKLGLPDYIIDDAKKRIREEDESFEDVIAQLEHNRIIIENEKAEIQSYKAQIESMKQELESRRQKFDEQREKILSRAENEAQRILQDAKDTADSSIRSINRLAKESGVNRQLEAERAKLRGKLDDVGKKIEKKKKAIPHKTVEAQSLRLGDTVKVVSMNLTGTVDTLPDAKGNLFVQMGILRSSVNVRDLEPVSSGSGISAPGYIPSNLSRKQQKRQGIGTGGKGSIGMAKSLSVSSEVKLIGMTTDEAVPAMEKYLDDAYIAHLKTVRVIHGRGTGALRQAIHARLRRISYVKEFRDGNYNEGGNGATIVTFKD